MSNNSLPMGSVSDALPEPKTKQGGSSSTSVGWEPKSFKKFPVNGSIYETEEVLFVPINETPNIKFLTMLDQEQQQFFLIHAPRSSGKTTTMQNIIAKLRHKYLCLYVSLEVLNSKIETEQEFYKKLHTCIDIHLVNPFPAFSSFDEFVEVMDKVAAEEGKDWILVLDEFDSLLVLNNTLRDAFLAGLRVVKSGRQKSKISSKATEHHRPSCHAVVALGVLIMEEKMLSPFSMNEIHRLEFWSEDTIPTLMRLLHQHTKFQTDEKTLAKIIKFTAGQPGFTMQILKSFSEFATKMGELALSVVQWEKFVYEATDLKNCVLFYATTQRIKETLKKMDTSLLSQILCADTLKATTNTLKALKDLTIHGILHTADQQEFHVVSPLIRFIAREELRFKADLLSKPETNFSDPLDEDVYDLELTILLVIRKFGKIIGESYAYAQKKDYYTTPYKHIQKEAVFHEEFYRILVNWTAASVARVVTEYSISSKECVIGFMPRGDKEELYLVQMGSGLKLSGKPSQQEHIQRLQKRCSTKAVGACYVNFSRHDDDSELKKTTWTCSNISVIMQDYTFAKVALRVYRAGKEVVSFEDFMSKSEEDIKLALRSCACTSRIN